MSNARRFTDDLLDDIRHRISLVDLIGRDVKLVRKGREYEGLCPFHNEKTPSFTVSEQKGFAHCFGCGFHGDAFGFLMRRGRTFTEAVTELADMVGVAVDGQRPSGPLAPVMQRQTPDEADAEDAASIDAARQLWRRSVDARGTVVETYLRLGRCLDLDAIGGLPSCLRLIPRLELWDKAGVVWVGPAMIAPMILPDRSLIGVHRTWLLPDGSDRLKIVNGSKVKGKKMLGKHMGALIPLSARSARMQGGEGIETSLSGWCAVPSLPAVALGSLGNFSGRSDGSGGWAPWDGLSDFTWLEDADGKDPADMARSVERGLARLAKAGVRPRRATPPSGMDMNDLYRRQA